ncbi:DUF222 domain-containing protein [Sinomonas cyclohexanicum]|uniref:DUF222 domain-containing protein n=1 Tax=Sinomonas cyclohexanicum TaxID=322009 RepID=UPI001E59E4DB|nr:DUF222 domain-containing protein [Corynebacterium cyclohexanicum]
MEELAAAGLDDRGTVALSESAWRAAERVWEVEWLVGGLSRARAAEARAHADRARAVRRIAVLLGADSSSAVERSLAPSLAAAEVAAELCLGPRAARALVAECLALTEPWAAPVMGCLDAGRLDREGARVVLHAAASVPAGATPAFIAGALAVACPESEGPEGLGHDAARVVGPSAGALARSLRRLAREHAAESLSVRARAARGHRRVDVEPGDDGMCQVSAYVALEDGALIDTRLQAIARAQPAGDPRTVSQRRADAFTALLLAPVPSAGAAPAYGAPAEGATGAGARGDGATRVGASRPVGTRAVGTGPVGPRPGVPRGGVRMELVVTIPHTTLVPATLPTALSSPGATGPESAPAPLTGRAASAASGPAPRGPDLDGAAEAGARDPDARDPGGGRENGPPADHESGRSGSEGGDPGGGRENGPPADHESGRSGSEGGDPGGGWENGPPGGPGFADAPGEILGYGLIPAEAARRLAAGAATWLRMLTDEETGAPLALGRTRYTPPAALRRYLALRDVGCRFPACDLPHPHTEADHTLEWARGGATDSANLALLCAQHHRFKTLGYWAAEQDPATGAITWTSPLGRTYTTAPPADYRPPPDYAPPPPPF